MFKRVTGTKDILPGEVSSWQTIEQISRKVFSVFNYKEIRVPLIEESALFNRSLGESTEIVQKQMFLIDNKGETYALRPEGTASIVRAYVENNLNKTAGFLKLYYIGPMFRLERPQKGRLRQFHHVGCEAIGAIGPDIDIEIISLADSLLKAYSAEGYKIKINSLGCRQDKQRLSGILQGRLEGKLDEFCEDCKIRVERNILRVLDCKNEKCQEVVKKLEINDTYLCPECKIHFDKVKQGLDCLHVQYEVLPSLVRGLDYYTRTVFEIKHESLGAQDAIGAGGRYDNLVSELGGPNLGAIGFAFGIERLLLVSGIKCQVPSEQLVYLIALGEEAKPKSFGIAADLRKQQIPCDINLNYDVKSLKSALRKANDLNARFTLILGDDELKKDVVALKDMVSGEQKEVRTEDLIKELKKD